MNKLRIVFMGTPGFAVGILDAIVGHGYDVVGVITAPDKPAGRGQQVKYSAVKEYALEKGLRILQPVNLKSESFLDELRSLQANLQVVVAFRMLPEAVWKMPELGTFNLHASLLPDYRGAAPINWALINGEKTTGVTTFFIDEKIDTGAVILRKETEVHPDETAGELHDRLMEMGGEAVIETLRLIAAGAVKLSAQDESATMRPAPKLNKENCRIDWSKPASDVWNLIRGLSPYPAAWTILTDNDKGWNIKIYKAELAEPTSLPPGTVFTEKKQFKVACADRFIALTELQLPGKKKMNAGELLNGTTFSGAAKCQ